MTPLGDTSSGIFDLTRIQRRIGWAGQNAANRPEGLRQTTFPLFLGGHKVDHTDYLDTLRALKEQP